MRLLIPDTARLLYKSLIFLLLVFSSSQLAAQDYDPLTAQGDEDVPEQSPRVSDASETINTLRKVPQRQIDKYRSDKNFTYATDPRYWQKPVKKKISSGSIPFSSLSGSTARMILFVIVAFIGIFVIYRLLIVNRLFEGSSVRRHEDPASEEQEIEETGNMDARIRKAEELKDYRMAIRLQYLKTLQMLDDRQLIRLQLKSTNSDYRNQLLNSRFFSPFGFLTRIYDYVWYGEFNLSQEQYKLASDRFTSFQTLLQH